MSETRGRARRGSGALGPHGWEAIGRGWGTERVLGTLAGGHRNAAYLVLWGGERFVAKTTRRSEAQLRWLAPLQEAARRAGFLVPALIPSAQGRLVEEGWTLEPFLPGERLTRGDLPELLPQLGAFHRLSAHLPQRPGFAAARDLLTQDAGGDADLAATPPDLAERCRDAWRPFADAPLVGLHGDLNPDNLLRHPSGAVALLDWDEARVDAAFYDRTALLGRTGVTASEWRAFLAWEVAVSWTLEPAHAARVAAQLSAQPQVREQIDARRDGGAEQVIARHDAPQHHAGVEERGQRGERQPREQDDAGVGKAVDERRDRHDEGGGGEHEEPGHPGLAPHHHPRAEGVDERVREGQDGGQDEHG
jgi:hypothetical protein